MNSFEEHFFAKYVPEWQKIRGIVHIHWLDIIGKILIGLFLWAFIPSYLYILSERLRDLVPFIALEVLLFLVFIKVVYDIFDWYNDVWIITDHGVVSLERALFKTTTQTLWFNNIEGIEVEKNGIIDSLFRKWDLVIHKIWSDTFILPNANRPYISIDLIESIKEESMQESEPDHRLSLIMDALWGVVDNYLDKKDKNKQKDDDFMWEYEVDENTIDLRK